MISHFEVNKFLKAEVYIMNITDLKLLCNWSIIYVQQFCPFKVFIYVQNLCGNCAYENNACLIVVI